VRSLLRVFNQQPLAAKVPEVTALFWVIKISTTASGEAISDMFVNNKKVGVVVEVTFFLVALFLQFAARRYAAIPYWFLALAIATAGTGVADTTAEVFSRTVAVNLTGTFLVIQAAAPLIQKAGRGTIVNIASGVGLMPTGPGSVAYVASKGGVVALTKSVAMELAPNIRVNSVCPGAVETAMTAGYIRTPAGDPNPAITARYAMGRHAQPEELAAAILFLTSDESSFMTGIALPVDGGRTFH